MAVSDPTGSHCVFLKHGDKFVPTFSAVQPLTLGQTYDRARRFVPISRCYQMKLIPLIRIPFY
jgi:hypothetical protein